jgi:hypothetical protein
LITTSLLRETNFSRTVQEALASETENFISVRNAQVQQEIAGSKSAGYMRALDDPQLRDTESKFSSYGKKFVDPEFPPLDSSLYKQNTTSAMMGQKSSASSKHPPVEWKRAYEFLGTDYQVFSGAIEPGDIRQGALGDCWFLCALAAIA